MKTSYSTTSGVKAPLSWLAMPLLCAAALFFAGCEKSPPAPETKLAGKTMGTYWQATIAAPMTNDKKQQLQQEIEQELRHVNQQMSTYIADSELSKFNQYHGSDVFAISPELHQVISKALQISRESDGIYDITVEPLVEAWGFGPKKVIHSPSKEEIARALAKVGYQKLTLTATGLQKSNPETEIDLSSIAKGYGVDRVGAVIQKAGYNDYLVDIGGEIRANGKKYNKAWTVAIETPEINAAGDDIQLVVSLSNDLKAVATSGNYRNYIDFAGERAVHTINPKTGQTAQSGLLSASVFARDCMTADGYATTLMALGEKGAWQFAEKYHLPVVLIYAGAAAHTFIVKKSTAFEQQFGAQ